MKTRLAKLALLVASAAAMAGCGQPYRYGYATYGPPPPRSYVVGRAPGPGYVWTDGYWDWRGGRYSWVDGRWARPPRPHATWVPGYWAQHGHAYRFHSGHWR
jgi:hypothetical protein